MGGGNTGRDKMVCGSKSLEGREVVFYCLLENEMQIKLHVFTK